MTGILRLRKAALITTGVLVAAASLVSFAESYRGLFLWASHHGLRGVWAVAWPLQVNVFIAVGELSLFIALADRWPSRTRFFPWLVVSIGLAASVAGNVGHITGTGISSHRSIPAMPSEPKARVMMSWLGGCTAAGRTAGCTIALPCGFPCLARTGTVTRPAARGTSPESPPDLSRRANEKVHCRAVRGRPQRHCNPGLGRVRRPARRSLTPRHAAAATARDPRRLAGNPDHDEDVPPP